MAETNPANQQRPVLEVIGLTKTYMDGEKTLTVLDNVDLRVMPAETCAIVGPSGSGKTTLLGLCAGLDDATSGSVSLDGHAIEDLAQNDRAALRGKSIGFVFQNFQLIPTLTAIENVLIPLELQGHKLGRPTAEALLGRVGLGKRLSHYPHQLSGGEQQRVALARAFVRPPKILFADEPTGNLDAETSSLLIDIIFELNRENGTALVLVTHDPVLAERADRIVRMQSGRVASNLTKF